MRNLNYYTDEDYNCPNCGMDGNECGSDPDNEYGLQCPNCGECFETPDV
jgi:transcription elongation factor Elf1